MAEEKDWNFFQLHGYEMCRSCDLIEEEFKKRQKTLTKQDIDLALIAAAMFGNLEGVKFLLDNGADIEAVDGNFDDAMILAASCGHLEVVRYLLKRGAPPNTANVHHYTPLVQACYKENIEMINLLLTYFDIVGCAKSIVPRCETENRAVPFITYYSNKMRPYPWHTPLIIAVEMKSLKLVRILLDAKVPINETNRRGETALHHAIENYIPEIFGLILAANADVNLKDFRGATPLWVACTRRNKEAILELLKHGANASWRYKPSFGFTRGILFEAASFASTELMKVLCETGADCDDNSYFGETPLIAAVKHNNRGAIIALIRHGCQLDSQNIIYLHGLRRNKTLLDFAVSRKNVGIIKLLYAAGGFTNDVLHKCLEDEKLRESCIDTPEIYELLEDYASYPSTLGICCRKVLRELLQKPLTRSVPQLGLPAPVRDFLLYADI